jgi:undecaprenyl-diphosphatase
VVIGLRTGVVGASRSVRSLAAFLWRQCRRHRWSLPLSLAAVFCFIRLASEMQEGEVDAFDKLLQGMVDVWRGSLDTLMLVCTRWGGVLPMTIVSVAIVILLLLVRRAKEARYLVFGAGGGLLLNQLLKELFHRARPGTDFVYLLPSLSSLSFPSGHTMGTTSVVGSLVVILHVVKAPRVVRLASIVLGSAAIVGVGLSRIYFGAHYPSDVIGGFLAAAAWVSVVTGSMYPRLLPGEGAAPGKARADSGS